MQHQQLIALELHRHNSLRLELSSTDEPTEPGDLRKRLVALKRTDDLTIPAFGRLGRKRSSQLPQLLLAALESRFQGA
ncbi:MAG: hypothetical protein HY040_20730 [Planctomycetes bacterium]|nr:hypothetical protein [Planctomycetota bacterium]